MKTPRPQKVDCRSHAASMTGLRPRSKIIQSMRRRNATRLRLRIYLPFW
jgi:hypothetical protein